MKIVILGVPKVEDLKGVQHALGCSGNILGVSEVYTETYGDIEVIVLAQGDDSRVGVISVFATHDLHTYARSLEGLDLAPYVELAFVGEEKTRSGYRILRVAWRFDSSKDRLKSACRPPSPEPWPLISLGED